MVFPCIYIYNILSIYRYLSSYSISFDKSLTIDLLKNVNWAQMVLLHVIGIGSYFYQYTYPKPYNLPVLIVTVSCIYHISILYIIYYMYSKGNNGNICRRSTSNEMADEKTVLLIYLLITSDMNYFWDFYASMYNMKKVDWNILLKEVYNISLLLI